MGLPAETCNLEGLEVNGGKFFGVVMWSGGSAEGLGGPVYVFVHEVAFATGVLGIGWG